MNDTPKDVPSDTRANETVEAFAAIGEFVQEFGQLCFALQNLIQMILQRGGLQDQQMAWIMVGQGHVAANALKDTSLHLIGHLYQGEDGAVPREVFGKIARDIADLIQHRNSLQHGVTFVGWGNEQDSTPGKIGGFKFSPSKAGAGTKSLPEDATGYHEWTAEAKRLTGQVWKFQGLPLVATIGEAVMTPPSVKGGDDWQVIAKTKGWKKGT